MKEASQYRPASTEPAGHRPQPSFCTLRVAKDQNGAEFVAKRKTRIAKQVRAFDRYERQRDFTIKRTYGPKSKAQSTWTIHRVGCPPLHAHDRCLDYMPLLPGLVMKPLLRRLFYGINFSPFIHEAQRRANATRSQMGDAEQLGPGRLGAQA
jgi:hypothetical protein